MNIMIKAGLLSGFLFPGAGQWFLKQRSRAALFAAAAAIPSYYITDTIMTQAQFIMAEVEGGNTSVTSITELVNQQVVNTNTQSMQVASFILGSLWVLSIVDAIVLARKQKLTQKEK